MEIFFAPIRKQNGIEFTESEKLHNQRFSSRRSDIETHFADIEHKFKRFHPKCTIRCNDLSIFNLQWKLAALMLNLCRAVYLFNYDVPEHHRSWMQPGFEFSYNDDPDCDTRVQIAESEHEDIVTEQNNLINELLNESTEIENSSDTRSHDSGSVLNESTGIENFSDASSHESESEQQTQEISIVIPSPNLTPITSRLIRAQRSIRIRALGKRKIRPPSRYTPERKKTK